MKDRSINILNEDCNGFNISSNNLIKATPKDRAKRMLARGRAKEIDKHVIFTQRQVTQYSFTGEKIKTYRSCAAAYRVTGIFNTAIGNVARGNAFSAGGYFWRWGRETRIKIKKDVETVKKERLDARRKKHGQKVTQYDFEGNKIATFYSLQEAELATNTKAQLIGSVLSGKCKSANKFFWKKDFGKDKIDLSKHKWGGRASAAKLSIKVKQLSLDGTLIKIYPSLAEAGAAVNSTGSFISTVCKHQTRTAKGYRWEYA
jgi:NUMOD1 domain